MRKITTGDLSQAIKPHFPIATDDMVRAWVEAGHLATWRNPLGRGWHYIRPESIQPFLLDTLGLTPNVVTEVARRLGLNFNQLTLFAA